MTNNGSHTQERVLLSALELFGAKGIAATSINEIAQRAGVTRVTVYRHFANKEQLVREAFLHIEQVFLHGLAELKSDPNADWEKVLNGIGEGLASLPSADVFSRAEELKRIYPAVYAAIQETRTATLSRLFETLFERTRRPRLLRPGLNRELFQAIFWELTINIFDNPRFQSLRLTDVELYRGMTNILLHGIIRDK